MLLFVHVYILLEVQTALLTVVVNYVFQLILGQCRHVISIVGTDEVLVETVKCNPTVLSALSRFDRGPARMLLSNCGNCIQDLLSVDKVLDLV